MTTDSLSPAAGNGDAQAAVTIIRGGGVRRNTQTLETLRTLFRRAGRTVLLASTDTQITSFGGLTPALSVPAERQEHVEVDDTEPQ
jgi:hypothetical protein